MGTVRRLYLGRSAEQLRAEQWCWKQVLQPAAYEGQTARKLGWQQLPRLERRSEETCTHKHTKLSEREHTTESVIVANRNTHNFLGVDWLEPWPSLSFATSMLPLFICKVAFNAGRSWCRRAGSCSRVGEGDWTDWDPCIKEEEVEEEEVEEEEDRVEEVGPGAELKLWEDEEVEEWLALDAVDWSPEVSAGTRRRRNKSVSNVSEDVFLKNALYLLDGALSCKASCL